MTSLKCKVCKQEVGNGHKCAQCNDPVHLICGKPVKGDEEGYGQKVVCFKCEKQGKKYPILIKQY